MGFKFTRLEIPDVILVTPQVFGDERGFFMESYKESVFREGGVDATFCQDNHSRSARGVLRGLHYQLDPKPQGKLVRVIRGGVFDVAADIRRDSPWFGQYVGATLTAENQNMLWVPPGFAHGFCVLEDDTDFIYKVTNEYSKEHESGIHFQDPDIHIDWPLPEAEILVSERDRALPLFKKAKYNFIYDK